MRKNLEKISQPDSSVETRLKPILVDAIDYGIGGARIKLELDIPDGVSFPVDSIQLVHLVRSLVSASASVLEEHGEISVTVWEAGESLEIEVADNGPALDLRPRFLPLAAATLGADLVWQNCPQGGAAVTAVVPRVKPKRSAA